MSCVFGAHLPADSISSGMPACIGSYPHAVYVTSLYVHLLQRDPSP